MLDVERAVRHEVGEALVAVELQGALDCRRHAMGEHGRQPFQHMDHAEDGVGADVLDRVVGIADHDFAGHVRLAVRHSVGIAAERTNVIEDPFVVAALLFHVFEEGVLISLVLCECGRQRKKRKRMLHVMVSLH